MNEIGIMQGRLTNPLHRTDIQFPLYNDREVANEFEKAKDIGLDYIEWIISKGTSNLFFGDFYAIIKSFKEHYVPINSICLDYLMDLAFENVDLAIATDTINWISNISSNIGCKLLIIPIYEKNMNLVINYLISGALDRFQLNIAFEFLDVNSYTGINFINDLNYGNKLKPKRIGCCFDIGNNCGRDIIEELENYNKHNKLYHIHIKEKDANGNSVELNKGVLGYIGWRDIFKFLNKINYSGNFTLQVARGKAGEEIETIKKQIEFIKALM